MEIKKKETAILAQELAQYPQEQLMTIKRDRKRLTIGLPKEIQNTENRISLTPQAVGLLINNGHHVVLETGAGNEAKFSDREYADAGAEIGYGREKAFEADLVLKISPPTPEELMMMKPGRTLLSALQMSNLHPDFLKTIARLRITGIAYEFLEDSIGGRPVVKAMSEIAGASVMLIASEYLKSEHGKGIILGGITGIPPTKVMILGAGTVAQSAARAALGLGADVKVFDRELHRLRRLKEHLSMQIYTSTFDDIHLRKELKEADVVIGSLRPYDGDSCIITEEMVSEMKPDSVIIDVSIDQGGCFETSRLTDHHNPVFRKYDVIHYCVPNIPSRVARTASAALSNIFTPILLQLCERGMEEFIYEKEWFTNGVYSYKGHLVNPLLARKFNLSYKDIQLLLAARF